MKALIMAAGRGTRISRYLSDRPKCTVDIGNISLIVNTIKELKKSGINEIAMVLGYRGEVVEELLKDFDVKFYYNYFYDVTNSIASAWVAKDFLDDDVIIMNGDVFFETSVLQIMLEEKLDPVLLCDSTRKEEADYKFYYEDSKLMKYGKELAGDDISGEYVGIAKISKKFLPVFKAQLENLIKNQHHGIWWEDVLYSLIKKHNIYVRDISDKFWAEVDYIEDYERILKFRDYKINFNIEVIKDEVAHSLK
ncbi:phosphocholine cytidylyltransferase family protein [Clostridium tagluense]|uniref:Nucleotidyltransferase n=1 Tax=Clostridium tagluense TaxID=360422 RepID=A0A401UHH2_9CLOT|nr:phosphocholine cytidylyltransferase family protein [Clostridium tagluense]GCD09001.1 nucleotidyltransferase [Clostridium tagluense]